MYAVVDCPSCVGAGRTRHPCPCRTGGDRFLIGEGTEAGQPYRDCERCGGTGTAAITCQTCLGLGRRRAQLVLTVVNLDTAAVASADLRPGRLCPQRNARGRHGVDLAAILRDLAAEVGAADAYDPSLPGLPIGPQWLVLPDAWRPELPDARRHELEAAALAACPTQWRVYLGRTPAPAATDPHAGLAKLCRVAEDLCLDLVVDARSDTVLAWDIRFELPGSPVPSSTAGFTGDLADLVAITTPRRALRALHPLAPAYWVKEGARRRPRLETLASLTQKLARLCDHAPGAIATRRDRRWHVTELRHAATTTALSEQDTGQVLRQHIPEYVRRREPPPPSWLGDPIHYKRCPDCVRPGQPIRCHCTLPDGYADRACASCGGAGAYASPGPCRTCRGSGRLFYGAVFTTTDLAGRTTHLSHQSNDPCYAEARTITLLPPADQPSTAHLTRAVAALGLTVDTLFAGDSWRVVVSRRDQPILTSEHAFLESALVQVIRQLATAAPPNPEDPIPAPGQHGRDGADRGIVVPINRANFHDNS